MSLSISLAAMGLLASLSSAQVLAACTPGVPSNGVTVTCSGTDQRNFSSTASSLTVNVSYTDQVGSDGSGNPVMQLTGSNNRINNQGWINPSYIGQQTVLTTGLQVGNAFTQNISITNYTDARLSGTSADLGASLLDLKGMAVDAQAGAGGKVTIVNSGTIQSERILGASVLVADMPVMAVYGGAQVEMTNMNDIYGRIAFQASVEGNIFTNTGTVAGSLSLGAGGGNNRFNAVTGSSVVSGGASSTDSVTVDSNSHLVFVRPGAVDGGAGASNTLALQNAIGGGSGTAGSGSVSAANFLNFSNLLVQAGSWTVSGALLTGYTITALTGGSLSVNNDAVFGSGDVSINNATLTTHAGTVNLANNILIGTAGMTTTGINTLALNGVVSGGATGTLIKNGSGTLRINGANTYAGGTTLNAGTAVVSTNQAFGAGGVAIGAAGARLDASGSVSLANNISLTGNGTFGGTGNLTLTGIVSNITSRSISKVGSGQLILTNANTYQGGTTLSGGTLSVGNNLALGSGDLTVTGASTLTSTQSVTLANKVVLAADLTVGGSNDITLNDVVSGGATAKLIKTGSGNLTLSGANTFQGGIELNDGTLTAPADNGELGSGALTVTGNGRLVYGTSLIGLTPITINNGSTLEFSNDVTVNYNAQMSGAGDLVKTGTGSLELFIASTLTGLVDVRQGTVKSAVSNALGNNPNLNIDSGALVTIDFGAGLKSLTGAGQITVNSGPLTIGNSNASSTFDGVISGPGAVIKAGTGLLTLTGINTHTGTTTVNGGRLNIASGGSLASSAVTVNNGGSISGSGTLTGGLTINNGGHLALASGNKLTSGALTLSSGSIVDIALGTPTVATPMASVNGNLAINASPTFNFTNAGDMANGIYRLFDYTGSLTYTGGTLGTVPTGILSGEITLDISQNNIVNVVVNSALLARQYWDGGGTYGNGVINGGTGVWNNVENNWTKANGNSIDGWNGVSAVFQGTAGLVIIEGTQTASSLLFSTSGYTLSNASGGLLSLVNTSAGSATISTDTGVSTLIDAQIGGAGKLEKTGAGTLILAGNNLHTGGTALTAGTLIVRRNTAVGSGTLALGAGTFFGTDTTAVQLTNAVVLNSVTNIVVGSGADLTLTGAVSGAGGLVKIGTGSLVLSGNNGQLGNTWLNAGGLVLGSNSALGLGTLNTLNNTTLDSGLAGVQIGNDVAMSGNLTFLGSRDMSLTGTVSGTGNLIKNGTSTLSLTGANTLNGSVTLNQGTLRLANNNSLGNANLVVGGVSALQAAAN
ncbi:beta strand repeat-containing protein, partial [Pseudomonas huaxiensis]|uniref:beta strand repeat-containing protein n=1 Tax=Pseudomonas huaxiensis TaxID=2213017 RepID=UPI0015AE7EE9